VFARVLEPLLGPRWKWWAGALVGVLTLPSIILAKWVSFDPAHFIELWIQLVGTAYIATFIVELAQERRASRDLVFAILDVVTNSFLPPIDASLETLAKVTPQIRQPASEDTDALTRMNVSLAQAESAISILNQMSQHTPLHLQIATLFRDADLRRWQTNITELADADHWSDADHEDIAALVRDLQSIRSRSSDLAASLARTR
jgi:uncharacterized membrane protein